MMIKTAIAVGAILLFAGCGPKVIDVDSNKQGGAGSGSGSSVDSRLNRIGVGGGGMGGSDNFVDFDSKNLSALEIENKSEIIYFDFDRFNIRPDMQPKVETNANLLGSNKITGMTIRLEGNCDEFGTDEYNYALGLKRAKSVKDALIEKGISESRMTLLSYGESKPMCGEKTQDCYAKNRRVDTKILP